MPIYYTSSATGSHSGRFTSIRVCMWLSNAIIGLTFVLLGHLAAGYQEWNNKIGKNCSYQGPLIQELFDTGYDARVFPAPSQGPLEVTASALVYAIIDLDEKNQILHGMSWVELSWSDPRLSWKEEDYGNLSLIPVPMTSLWTPSITINNMVGTSKPEAAINAETAQVSVASTGRVTVESVLVHSTFCQVTLTNFPYDSQVCNISVNYPGYAQFIPGIAKNLEWSLSPQWIVSDVYIGTYVAHSPLDHKSATFFDIVITLDRLPNFHLRNIVCPLVLLNALAMATFLIPLKSGERVSACLAIVLGLTVFQIIITDFMPKTSHPTDEPIIIRYGVSSFVLLVFVTISSIVSTNISTQLWTINNGFARWLLLDVFPTITFVKNIRCQRKNDREEDSSAKFNGSSNRSGRRGRDSSNSNHVQVEDTENKGFISGEKEVSIHATPSDMDILAGCLDRLFLFVSFVASVIITVRAEPLVSGTFNVVVS